MLGTFILTFIILGNVAPTHMVIMDFSQDLKQCNLGDVIENECNRCTCTKYNIYDCISKGCLQNAEVKEESSSKLECHSNMMYVQGVTACICDNDGNWPHNDCKAIFRSLPASNVKENPCEPNTYVIIDACNICYCDSNGKIDEDRCTKNDCEKNINIKTRRAKSTDNVYGNCEPENWYSLAPCQFCYCVNRNKLVCNTGNYNPEKLQLGTYNLTVCGTQLIKEAVELMPSDQKALRLREKNENIAKLSPTVENIPKEQLKSNYLQTNPDVNNLIVEVNRENNKQDKTSVKQEYYSDSDEDKSENEGEKESLNKIVSTQLPFQDDDENYSNDSNEIPIDDRAEAKNVDESDDTTEDPQNFKEYKILDLVQKVPEMFYSQYTVKNSPTSKTIQKSSSENRNASVKLNIPMVLDKIFNAI